MDLSRFAFADWQQLASLQLPETVFAALVSATATIALIAGFSPQRDRAGRREAPVLPGDGVDCCEYLIEGSSLKPLTEPGRALLASLDREGSRLNALKTYLKADCPTIDQDIENLVFNGVGFRHHCPKGDGTAIEVTGEPRGSSAFLSMRPASEDARALREAQEALARAEAEIDVLTEVIDRAPVLAWRQGPDDQVIWANKPYHQQFDTADAVLPEQRVASAFAHVMEEVPLTPRGAELRRRVAVSSPGDAEPLWYEINQFAGAEGETTGFALEADELVAAEASLRRFVETLTETFAHLPIGLAVFDKNRRLGLFNPALTELVKIDAVWLAGRPSLRDFLERLREIRQMPEQKDFTSWRRKLSELEEGARDGTYEENWVLPSGKIFRVTGRPHPQGALAFLFEDISTNIMLERKYRSELELSQATLDRLSEAVAVFDASGTLVIANSAFEQLWDINPAEKLEGPQIGELSKVWAGRCKPSHVWSRFTEFTTSAEARTNWEAEVETSGGEQIEIAVAPLPDASALIVFRKRDLPAVTPAQAGRDTVLDELALGHLQIPAETAVRQVMSAIPAAQSQEAFKGLSAAVQNLKDGLSRSREIRALSGEEAGGDRPLAALSAALAGRGLELQEPEGVAEWPSKLRGAAMALGLAAADHAVSGTAVVLSFEEGGSSGVLTATAQTAGGDHAEDGPGIALARRIVEASSGKTSVKFAAKQLTISADLPRKAIRRDADERISALRA